MSSEDGASMLEWMNTFPGVKELGLTDIKQVVEGNAIPIIWNQINQNKIPIENLETPKNENDWLSILKNVRAMDSVMAPVLQDKNIRQRLDLTAISRAKSESEIIKMIQPIVGVALTSDDSRTVVQRIKTMSQKAQNYIKGVIKSLNIKPKSQHAPESPARVESPRSQHTVQFGISPSSSQSGEDLQRIIFQKEERIAILKKQIAEHETQLNNLNHSKMKASASNEQVQADILDNMENAIQRTTNENIELKTKLKIVRNDVENVKTQVATLNGTLLVLSKMHSGNSSVRTTNQSLHNIMRIIERTSKDRPEILDELTKHQADKGDLLGKIDDIDAQLAKVREEITASIQIATKYATGDDKIEISENDNQEDVQGITELMIQVNKLEVELATGVSPESANEQINLKKRMTKLARFKKALEEQGATMQTMRNDLQRVQEDIIGRRESVESTMSSLESKINESNTNLVDWVAFQAAYKAWHNSPTLLTELRHHY